MTKYYVIIGITFSALFVACAWKVLNWAWLKPRKVEKMLRKQGLNGNSYTPLYGDLKDTFSMKNNIATQNPFSFTHNYISYAFPFLHYKYLKYGQNCFTWLGPTPMIHVAQPELLGEIYNRINEFRRPALNPVVQLIYPGLSSLEGEKWATHRKIINPAFHMEKLKLMLPAFRASVIELIENWENLIPKESGVELDVWPDITYLTSDVISRAAFGSNFDDGRQIFELLKEQSQMAVRLLLSIYIPGWKYVPTKANRRMKELDIELRRLVKGIIEKRKKAMDAGEPGKDDLLGILMESNYKETTTTQMSLKDVIDECKLFYLAGQESTSTLITWTMVLLGKYPDWQIKARDEVFAICGNNLPDVDGVNHLKLVTMILYEVLRLYPPVPSTVRSVYGNDIALGNLTMPQGAMVCLDIYHAHHDPKLWGDDANEFKPSRFSEGILKASNGNPSFLPFLGGPRICIGQNFTLVEAKMAITMILQRFSFELSPSYTHAPTAYLTLQPEHGAHLIVRRF